MALMGVEDDCGGRQEYGWKVEDLGDLECDGVGNGCNSGDVVLRVFSGLY